MERQCKIVVCRSKQEASSVAWQYGCKAGRLLTGLPWLWSSCYLEVYLLVGLATHKTVGGAFGVVSCFLPLRVPRFKLRHWAGVCVCVCVCAGGGANQTQWLDCCLHQGNDDDGRG